MPKRPCCRTTIATLSNSGATAGSSLVAGRGSAVAIGMAASSAAWRKSRATYSLLRARKSRKRRRRTSAGSSATCADSCRTTFASCGWWCLLRRLHLAGVVDEAAGLAAPHGGVAAVAGDQLAVRALLDDAAVLEHDQAVHLRDGGKTMGDGDHGLALHQGAKARLDRGFDFAVERRSRFVEHQDRGVFENGPRGGAARGPAAG